jgi:hypothetical protein
MRSCAAKFAVPAAIVLHTAITIPLAFALNIWVDECYSLFSTSGTLAEAYANSIDFERQAPGYFVVLKLWRCINPSPAFARLL